MVKLSKQMSRVLRHDPASAGLVLDPAGWVPVSDLLRALRLRRAELDLIVAGSDKQRFAVESGADGVDRIRANQGHSVQVDLGLPVTAPPARLYHGTGTAALASIWATGLNRGGRHHVHLSADVETARRVGSRQAGKVTILEVDAERMASDGYPFFRSANGVWLADSVPPEYLATVDPRRPD